MMNDSEKPVDWFFAIMGLMDDEGNHKPSYYTYKLLIEKLSGFTKVEKITNYDVFKFQFGGKYPPVYIAWNHRNINIDLSKEISGKVKVFDIITTRGKTDENVVARYVESDSIKIGNTPIMFTKK
jgi:hypothetical protein